VRVLFYPVHKAVVGAVDCEKLYFEDLPLKVNVQFIRQLRKTKRRWMDNIKMDLQEVGCEGMDWIDLAQGRDM